MRKLTTKNNTPIYPIGFGTMPISAFYFPQPKKEEAIQCLLTAFSMGYNVVDTAMVYGNGQDGESEELVGYALSKVQRESIFLSTKCGLSFENKQVTLGCKKEHILLDCENSLKRLGASYIDVFFLHRIDPHTSLEESLEALVQLKNEGKIRYLGFSEVDAATIEKAVKILKTFNQTLDFIQNEYSLISRQDEQNNVLVLCQKYHINYMAYSPLGRGLLANTQVINERFSSLAKDDFRNYLPRFNNTQHLEHNKQFVTKLQTLANRKNATVSQIALAWLLHQAKTKNIQIIPIPGTKNIQYIKSNYEAEKIQLTPEEVSEISASAPRNNVQGERWPQSVAQYAVRSFTRNSSISKDNKQSIFSDPPLKSLDETTEEDLRCANTLTK